jgi:hypothetical protein
VAEELAVTRPDLVSVVVISLAARPASMYQRLVSQGVYLHTLAPGVEEHRKGVGIPGGEA